MEPKKISQMSNFEQRILHQSFKQKFSDSSKLLDIVLDQNPEVPEIKNVCAKLHISLVERLENVIKELDMSKREFIELALIEAMDKAESILDDVEPFAAHYVEENK